MAPITIDDTLIEVSIGEEGDQIIVSLEGHKDGEFLGEWELTFGRRQLIVHEETHEWTPPFGEESKSEE